MIVASSQRPEARQGQRPEARGRGQGQTPEASYQ